MGLMDNKSDKYNLESNNFSWKRVFSLSGNRWGTLLLILSTMLAQSALTPLTPIIIAEIIDKGFTGTSKYDFKTLLMFLFIVAVIQVLVHISQNLLIMSLTSRIIFNVRLSLYEHLQRQSIKFFTNNKAGDIISRITSEANTIGDSVFKPIIYSFQTLLTLIGTIVAMFTLNWQISLIILLVTPFLFIPLPIMGKFAYNISKKLVESNSEANSFINENLSINGIMLLKLFGRKNVIKQRFIQLIDTIRRLTIKQTFLGGIYDTIFTLGTASAPILMYWLGRPGGPFEISAGTAVAFSSYIASLFNPIQNIGRIAIIIQSARITFERLFSYLDTQPDSTVPDNPVKLKKVNGKITFQNVCFEYTENTPALNNVSFTILPKEKVAIVGYSGSGKTTLAYLLSRLYEPTNGAIFIDDINLRDIHPDDVSNYVGLITQEVFLLHTTIRENILLAKPDATDEEIIKAAKEAYIHDKIVSLPEGYNTIVGERGYKLSGGEKQRIAIARAFLQNPPILVLDEATSSLDSHSEEMIQKALLRLAKDRTVISITHRISSLSSSDRIIVMDKGRIVQNGTSTELLQEDGLYAQLYKKYSQTDNENQKKIV
jgi:ATP-binding cassette, subfamily B, bacterial